MQHFVPAGMIRDNNECIPSPERIHKAAFTQLPMPSNVNHPNNASFPPNQFQYSLPLLHSERVVIWIVLYPWRCMRQSNSGNSGGKCSMWNGAGCCEWAVPGISWALWACRGYTLSHHVTQTSMQSNHAPQIGRNHDQQARSWFVVRLIINPGFIA